MKTKQGLQSSKTKPKKKGDSEGTAFAKALKDHLPSLNMDVLGGMVSGFLLAGAQSVGQRKSTVSLANEAKAV